MLKIIDGSKLRRNYIYIYMHVHIHIHAYTYANPNTYTYTYIYTFTYTVTRTDAKFRHIWWMSQNQTTGLTEFSNMCISTETVDISNTFQYQQWNFPTLSNMNIGIFLNISLHIVEFSNILQHK
jgi:hypothetical protein